MAEIREYPLRRQTLYRFCEEHGFDIELREEVSRPHPMFGTGLLEKNGITGATYWRAGLVYHDGGETTRIGATRGAALRALASALSGTRIEAGIVMSLFVRPIDVPLLSGPDGDEP